MTDINIGAITEALNDKADRDFNNMNPSSTAKETIVGWGVPDYSATLSSVGNNYTAPCDGIFWFSVANSNNTRRILIKPANSSEIEFTNIYNSYGSPGGYQVVLAKGDRIIISDASTSLSYSYFIPFKGMSAS